MYEIRVQDDSTVNNYFPCGLTSRYIHAFNSVNIQGCTPVKYLSMRINFRITPGKLYNYHCKATVTR